MKTIVYTGRSRNQDYLSHARFLMLMKNLGAEEVLADFQHLVYSFQCVSILRTDLGIIYSSIESIASCTLELIGEKENIGRVEKKILHHFQNSFSIQKVSLGL